MKAAADIITRMSADDIAILEKSNHYALSLNGDAFDITLEDVEIVAEDIPGWQVATDAELVVALDLTLDPGTR